MKQNSSSMSPCPSDSRHYMKSGIGGAGNFRASSHSPITSIPRTIPQRTTGTFLTGIGGAGNFRKFEDRAMITHAKLPLRENSFTTSWHQGIGGAGNRSSSRDSSRSSSVVSEKLSLISENGQRNSADKIKQSFARISEGCNTLFKMGNGEGSTTSEKPGWGSNKQEHDRQSRNCYQGDENGAYLPL